MMYSTWMTWYFKSPILYFAIMLLVTFARETYDLD
jgi:hypothetical protein